MKLALVEGGTITNTIKSDMLLPGYVQCPDFAGIGWTTPDNINFNPPISPAPDLENYRKDSLIRVESFEDRELKDILGKTLGHKTVATLIRFMAAAAYNAGTATSGQTARIVNEASQRGLNPATMAANAANNFNAAQGQMGSLDGIIKTAEAAVNNATSIAQIDQAIQNAISAWQAL